MQDTYSFNKLRLENFSQPNFLNKGNENEECSEVSTASNLTKIEAKFKNIFYRASNAANRDILNLNFVIQNFTDKYTSDSNERSHLLPYIKIFSRLIIYCDKKYILAITVRC